MLINLVALLFNIPRFMCWKWKDGKAVKTELYDNPTFKTSYRIWINFIFLFVIPLIILIVLNSLLFSEVRKSNFYDVQVILVEDHVTFARLGSWFSSSKQIWIRSFKWGTREPCRQKECKVTSPQIGQDWGWTRGLPRA